MSTIVIEHLARVEGHGGITVELEGDTVTNVRFDIFEGSRLLEPLVRGKRCEEVAPILSRICSICSGAHTLTSLKATEAAFGIRVSPQTELLRELMFRGESIESHALHLFLLAVPDYLNYPSATAMAADKPGAVLLGLRLKKLGNQIQEVIGGRAVHPVNAVLGGFGRVPSVDQVIGLRSLAVGDLVELRDAVDQHRDLRAELLGQRVERVVGVLDRVVQQRRHQGRRRHPQLGQDGGDCDRVRDVRVAALAHLPAMRALSDGVRLLDGGEVSLGIVRAKGLHQRLEARGHPRAAGSEPHQARAHPAGRR